LLQERLGSVSRAKAFYQKQMLDRLNDDMRRFIGAQELVFIASADGKGECDCSFRAGPKGFVHVFDERALAYPEYRGNGVHGSVGNMLENPHVGMIFVDFFRAAIGLHVNGKARIFSPAELCRRYSLPASYRGEVEAAAGRQPELWVVIEVEEAYVHCSKHIPLLTKLKKEVDWGTDDVGKKGGDFFHVKNCVRPWADVPAPCNGTE
jgi:predicted pyridoxine 5'-phosphate oxidase superfamily flavin-nucleotide-binding protein